MIKTKSVWSPIDRKGDGLRILATRFRGRGLRATRYSIWMANLGPSERLLASYRQGRIKGTEFRRRYRAELKESTSLDQANETIKNHGQKFTLRLLQYLARRQTVTLLCHCDEDNPDCHRHVLKRVLDSRI